MANTQKPATRSHTTFSASDQRDKLVRDLITQERAATDAKTARLKALRLEKEAAEPPPAPAPAPRKRASRKAS